MNLKKNLCKIIIDKKQNNIPFFLVIESLFFLYDDKNFSENSDADLSIREISKKKKNIIIIDDYSWQKRKKKVSPYCNKIIAIDDFIYKKHHVDILINSKPELSNPDSKTLKIIKKIIKKNNIFTWKRIFDNKSIF